MRGLHDAREARKRLDAEFSRIHERHQLKREYQRLLEAGHKLLSQIEQVRTHFAVVTQCAICCCCAESLRSSIECRQSG
jgi:hypothetical protein